MSAFNLIQPEEMESAINWRDAEIKRLRLQLSAAAKELRIGPDVALRGHDVFVNGVLLGTFDKPWETAKQITRGVRAWTDSLAQSQGSADGESPQANKEAHS